MIESANKHLKYAVRDGLLLRGTVAFTTLAGYRGFIAELVGRRNRRNVARIDAGRAVLNPLPVQRTADYEDTVVAVTPSNS